MGGKESKPRGSVGWATTDEPSPLGSSAVVLPNEEYTSFHFDEATFKAKLAQAAKTLRKLLDTTRDPKLPLEVPHVYDVRA